MKKLLLISAFVLLAVLSSSAQSGEKSGMIKTAKGVLVVWNEPGNYYTIEIKGNKILPAEQPLLFKSTESFSRSRLSIKRHS